MLRNISVCIFALLAAVLSTSATAQTFDSRTYFTFSQPVVLPGVTLPAGADPIRVLLPGARRCRASGRSSRFLIPLTWSVQIPSAPNGPMRCCRESSRTSP